MPVPTGYLRRESGEVVLDPDEEVRDVVRLIFETFDRVGTTRIEQLVKNKVQIGVRLRTGSNIGQLVWQRPHRGMLANILRNPIYAGTYAYGRRRVDPRRQIPGRPATGRTPLLPQKDWQVCLPNKLPAYITSEQYVRNQDRLKTNQAASGSMTSRAREGTALLPGLVVCARCKYRMVVQYSRSRNGTTYARYMCTATPSSYGAQLVPYRHLISTDRLQLALAALAPAALE
jgi:hypothetical protein